jgi:putative hydrolase of the HAD superfamily
MSIFKVILFDLGNTLLTFPEGGLESETLDFGRRKSIFESLVKTVHSSLVRNGFNIDWSKFLEAYKIVRAQQMKWQKETLREYDMSVRLARVLENLGFKMQPTSEIIHYAREKYYEGYIKHVKMEKNALTVLKSLHSRHKLGLVTNFSHPPCIHAMLDKFSLRQLFDVIVVSGEIGWVKPSPKIFYATLSKLRLKPHQVIFVGDDPETDIKGAKNIGMKTIFLSSSKPCDYADATIPHLAKLPDAIEELEAVNVGQ